MTFRWIRATLVVASSLTLVAVATTPAPAAPPGHLVYVAMGDSYSAGPLIPTQTDPVTCIRSDNNYPGIVARTLSAITFRDVTCSSASTADFSSPQRSNTTGPPAPPQYDALTKNTTLVTVGIGGNDIGLITVGIGCIVAASNGTSCAAANGKTYEKKIDAFAATYGTVIDTIHAKSPRARIIMVSYPTAIRDGGCFPEQPINPEDATYLQSLIRRLDARMREQSAMHHAAYVDLQPSTVGHDACAPTGERWLEGAVPTSPAYPLHPNALGMANAAVQVLAKIGS